MSDVIYCLVSRLPSTGEKSAVDGITIIACSVPNEDRKIAIADGWSPHDHGSVLTPARMMAYQPYKHEMEDGKHLIEQEPQGWFDRRSVMLGCPWFPPLVRRMADGEVIEFDEIRDAYRAHNHAQDIPTGKWWQLAQVWNAAGK